MDPSSRINYSGDFTEFIKDICNVFQIGPFNQFSIIDVGFEDCNVIIETEKGKFVTKIFSKERSAEDVKRYIEIIQKVIEAGIRHPSLLKTSSGSSTYQFKNVSLVVMEFIEGKTFYAMKRRPDNEELSDILEQASKVNIMDYKPSFIFDSWAIPHIEEMYAKVKQFMSPEDQNLVDTVINRYKSIPIDSLPHAFVHGDFTKTNLLRSEKGDIFVLDFSVSNWYPRIQELSVIAANLLHEESGPTLQERCQKVIEGYENYTKLTEEEKKYLYPYSLAGVAMEFIGAHQEKYLNGNDTTEADYWLNLGKDGLKEALNK